MTPKQFAALQKRVVTLEKTNKQIILALGVIVGCAFDQGAIPTTKAPEYHVTATGETTVRAEAVAVRVPKTMKRS